MGYIKVKKKCDFTVYKYVYLEEAVTCAVPNQAFVTQLNCNGEDSCVLYSLPSDPNAFRGQAFHTFHHPVASMIR